MHRYAHLQTDKYVFFPYEIIDDKAKIIELKDIQKNYPQTYQYIMDNEQAFKARESGKIGKWKDWYALSRSNNLTKFDIENNIKIIFFIFLEI